MRDSLLQSAAWQLAVCNSCRYCEGYCAVFPALERRQTFEQKDVAFIANLCHDCRACYYACAYAPPHEYGINIPQVLSDTRVATYEEIPLSGFLKALTGRTLVRNAAFSLLAVLLVAAIAVIGHGSAVLTAHRDAGAFYAVIPWVLMVVPGLLLGGYVAGSLAVGVIRFARLTRSGEDNTLPGRAFGVAALEAVTLRWLRGDDEGCHYPRSGVSRWRMYLHVSVSAGFVAAFLATIVAAVYQDALGVLPPYPVLSLPVILGSVGGLGMIAGCAGLLALKLVSDRDPASLEMRGLDVAFIFNLGMASLTGMLLVLFRETDLLGVFLVLHLGTLGTLFLTAPYTKFAHFVYRYAALVQNRAELHAEMQRNDGATA